MTTHSRVGRPRRRPAIGDMDKLITLQRRRLTPPSSLTEAGEAPTFEREDDVWASVVTRSGKTVIDGTNTERVVTHEFTIYYRADIDAQDTWVLWGGRRFDVIDHEDFEERQEFLRLLCSETGKADQQAATA